MGVGHRLIFKLTSNSPARARKYRNVKFQFRSVKEEEVVSQRSVCIRGAAAHLRVEHSGERKTGSADAAARRRQPLKKVRNER